MPLLQAALKLDPSSPSTKLALAEALLDTGHGAEALTMLESLKDWNPRLRRLAAIVQFLLARAYQENGRVEDAKRAREKYQELMREREDEELASQGDAR